MKITRKIRCAAMMVAMLVLGVEQLPAQVAPTSSVVAVADTLPLQTRGAWDGARAAEQRSTRGAFAGGVASGLVAPFWGLIIAWPVAGRSVVPDSAGLRAMADTSRHYDAAFRSAYERETKSRRRAATVRGNLLGSIPWLALMIVMSGP